MYIGFHWKDLLKEDLLWEDSGVGFFLSASLANGISWEDLLRSSVSRSTEVFYEKTFWGEETSKTSMRKPPGLLWKDQLVFYEMTKRCSMRRSSCSFMRRPSWYSVRRSFWSLMRRPSWSSMRIPSWSSIRSPNGLLWEDIQVFYEKTNRLLLYPQSYG